MKFSNDLRVSDLKENELRLIYGGQCDCSQAGVNAAKWLKNAWSSYLKLQADIAKHGGYVVQT